MKSSPTVRARARLRGARLLARFQEAVKSARNPQSPPPIRTRPVCPASRRGRRRRGPRGPLGRNWFRERVLGGAERRRPARWRANSNAPRHSTRRARTCCGGRCSGPAGYASGRANQRVPRAIKFAPTELAAGRPRSGSPPPLPRGAFFSAVMNFSATAQAGTVPAGGLLPPRPKLFRAQHAQPAMPATPLRVRALPEVRRCFYRPFLYPPGRYAQRRPLSRGVNTALRLAARRHWTKRLTCGQMARHSPCTRPARAACGMLPRKKQDWQQNNAKRGGNVLCPAAGRDTCYLLFCSHFGARFLYFRTSVKNGRNQPDTPRARARHCLAETVQTDGSGAKRAPNRIPTLPRRAS